MANTTGQLLENYNVFACDVPRTNVSAGANSITDFSKAALVDMGQTWLSPGRLPRFIATPNGSSSPLLGLGNNAVAPSTDLLGRTRPNPPSVGALEDSPIMPGASGGIMTPVTTFGVLVY